MWDDIMLCAKCHKEVKRSELHLTYDCHGIPFRYVCEECYDEIDNGKGYDGEYYTALDENLDWDY